MAKYVTFYWSRFKGIINVVEHKDKETARKYFLSYYKKYFTNNIRFDENFEPPFCYGYPHRKLYIMTKNMYEKKIKKGE